MPKAIVCIGATQLIEDLPSITYTVTVMGLPMYSYASDYIIDASIPLEANLAALRNKVISQAAEYEVKLQALDVTVFGAPL